MKAGGVRFKSLLGKFGLEDRIVDITKPLNINSVESPIPDSVYETLTLLRKKSINFLNKVNNE